MSRYAFSVGRNSAEIFHARDALRLVTNDDVVTRCDWAVSTHSIKLNVATGRCATSNHDTR